MAAKKELKNNISVTVVQIVVLVLLTCAPWCIHSAENRLLVNMTLVRNSTASVLGAFCLDGSLPAYHLHRGFGAGAHNWLLQFETSLLYFRGQKIWQAILLDLLPKGMANARKALLSGCSAGGLAVFLHCDNFIKFLPRTASVKCLSDAGFFLDERDISLNHTMRSFYKNLVDLQCFFPQYALKYISTPLFVLNSAYDVFQFHHTLVPPSADLRGHWNRCKLNPAACSAYQIDVLQGFRNDMLEALRFFLTYSRRDGMFINSCFAHCQSESQDTWFSNDSPRIHDKTIAEAVGDWYYSRRVTKEIDCPYPCDTSCHNLIP
ncbi:hypothetical protein JRO89_XS11G0196800 [Xanthoceras sorbifolium]|uniref:Pectin acetylesterase n=1 Tax=Xanthoceras sorbifolium TaxID=99658 RepID=A0ABQ8HG86_9ROSI|nr:hypothetical protein JRO89_XS11G0196800 [Xanthoceras sorbifolium]